IASSPIGGGERLGASVVDVEVTGDWRCQFLVFVVGDGWRWASDGSAGERDRRRDGGLDLEHVNDLDLARGPGRAAADRARRREHVGGGGLAEGAVTGLCAGGIDQRVAGWRWDGDIRSCVNT